MSIPQVPGEAVLDAIILIETGDPTPEEYAAAFQTLINTGIVWSLQGWYGRAAVELHSQGRVELTTEP